MPRMFTLVWLVVALATGQSVQADIVSFNSTVPSILFGSPSSGNVLLHQFDPSLGTLTSVSISGSLSLAGSGTATSTLPAGNVVGANATESFTLTVSNAALGINQVSGASLTLSGFTLTPGPFFLSGTGTKVLTTITDNNAAHFSTYSGLGTIPLTLSTSNFTTSNVGSSVNPASLNGSIGGGTISVAYTFTPAAVPEPSSMALVALTAGAVGLRRWQKRKGCEPAAA